MRKRAPWLYLVGGLPVIAGYLLLPPFKGSSLLFELVGLTPVVAIGFGIRWYRPRPRLPWLLFMVAQVFFVSGDFFYYTFHLPFPSFADGLYIAYYPIQAAGLLLLIRSRTPGKDSASLIDALIIAGGFGLLSWIYLIDPYTGQVDVSQFSRMVSMAYPAMDVLLLAVAARLVMGTGARPRAFYLMGASILCLIATDAVYGAIQLNGTYTEGNPLDLGWMATYLLWGAAALDPSMRELSVRATTAAVPLTPKRLLLLAAATMIAPGMLLANNEWPIAGFDVPVAAGAAAVMFVLVLVRMMGLVSSQQEAVARHERAEERETILRQAATALAVAPDRERIRDAAMGGAMNLIRGLAAADIVVDICDGNAPTGGPPITPTDAVVVPLSTQAAVYGRLVVTSAEPVPTDVVAGLRTLGAQVALALEAAALTEDLGRQRSEARVGALVQNSSDVIMVLDAGLAIRYVTPSVVHVLGYHPDALLGTVLPELLDPAGRTAAAEFFSGSAHLPGESARTELRIRHGDGRFTDIEAVATDLLKNPSINGIVLTARDITERKRFEEGLKHQVTELEELDRIRGEFVATVSHELRTPLTSIIGQVELIADGDLGELSQPQLKGIEVIGRNSERLFALIEDLLTLSHIETSALQLHREPTPVAGLVDDTCSQVGSVAVAKSVALVVECCPEAGTAFVDREQVGRALVNLLTNAVKFTPAGGTVDLRAWREDTDLVFTVSDTGIGIPLDEQRRLFTRFFRSSEATRMAIQGTGLGLVIVKKIVEEHGGTISITSVPHEGTSVTVKIPADAVPPGLADAA